VSRYFWTIGTRLIILFLLLVALLMNMKCTPSFEADNPPWSSCYSSVGEHPCDFKLIDQNGEEVSLYDHYGKVIIIDFSTMWCGPCQMAARSVDPTIKKFGEENIAYITIIIENTSGQDPDLDDLQLWGTHNNIELGPILAGSRQFIYDNDWQVEGWPTFYIIDKNMVLRESVRGYNGPQIDQRISTLVAEPSNLFN